MVESTVIEKGLIVTGDEKGTIIQDGFIEIQDNLIANIGEGKSSGKPDVSIDAQGCVIIPGLITAHTHLYGILLRGASLNIQPPIDFAQILQRVWWPVDEALTVEDAKASAISASADMLRNGSTFFADTYSGPNSIEGVLDYVREGADAVGIRSMLAFEMTERNNPDEARRGLRENVRFIESLKKTESLASGMMSIHASFTVEDFIVGKAMEAAERLEVPITVHTSEGLVDLYHNLEKYGERTIERLERTGILSPRTVLAHCVHVNNHELDLVSKYGASIAHNPMSNALNAVGTAPVPDMLSRGITVGLGNDGWIFDPFENMRFALTVHRLTRGDPSVMGPDQVFKMATIDGARCYGLDKEIGSLEKGKLADITILDGTNIPTPLTQESVVGHLINSFSGRDVKTVFVNGRKVVDNRSMVLMRDEEVAEISRKSAKSLWSKLK
ncbi:MAG: amidohydrolase family protein [Candidatus Thorarchaeota archaeon]|nr:amidohydrolase family protein [Candidatus Thorarchaeota archaeon]